ncbi:MAG: hypothetical protein AAF225_00965 [Pseudomonadota bacterium]
MRQTSMDKLGVQNSASIGNKAGGEGSATEQVRERMMALKSLVTGAVALTVAIAGTAGAAPKKEKAADITGAALIELAAEPYIQFRQDVDEVGKQMPKNTTMMRDAHYRLASHDQMALAGAWIAYAAMVAADEPAFANSVADRIRRRGGADGFIKDIQENPGIVRNLPGSQDAVSAVLAFAAGDAAKIKGVGDSFISEAYSMQKAAWARRELAERGMERVDNALAFAARRGFDDTPEVRSKTTRRGVKVPNLEAHDDWATTWSDDKVQLSQVRAGSIVTKALVLGAHYAMDEADTEVMASFGTSARSQRCFSNAKLNLDQCIAATRTPYEEAFCLGQHALNDMSSCVGWPAAAGSAGS